MPKLRDEDKAEIVRAFFDDRMGAAKLKLRETATPQKRRSPPKKAIKKTDKPKMELIIESIKNKTYGGKKMGLELGFGEKLGIGVAIVFVLLVGTVLFGLSPIFSVPAGHAGIVFNNFGGGVKPMSYGEGWNFKIPLVETSSTYDCRVMKQEIDATAASKDMQNVQTKIALNFHADKTMAWNIYQLIGDEYEAKVITPAVEEAVRAVTAQYTAEELISRREEVSVKIKDLITQKMAKFNILVDAFNIINFDFSKDFNAAIEAKQTAQQQAQMEKNVLEKIKIQAEQRAAEAEGMRQAAVLQANGAAEAKLKVAEAEAKAIELQGAALRNNPDVIRLRQIEKWNGQVPTVSLGGNSIPMINLGDITKQ